MVRCQWHYHTKFPNHQTPAFAALLAASHAAADAAELAAIHAAYAAWILDPHRGQLVRARNLHPPITKSAYVFCTSWPGSACTQ